jgi:diguanylate cyclase (GGDEF)-like protein
MFDVDGFKRVNDELGHPTGDAILQHIARSIRDSVRQDDLVARIGGDEFALIASGLTLAQAASRLRGIVNNIAGERIGDHNLTVSLSCGVSEHSAGDTVQTLISRTDAALNEAKSLGKNRVVARHAPYIRTLLRRSR